MSTPYAARILLSTLLVTTLTSCLQQTITQGVTAFSTPNANQSAPESVASAQPTTRPVTSGQTTNNNTLPSPSSNSSSVDRYSASWLKMNVEAKRSKMDFSSRDGFKSISFIDFKTGWAVGPNGTIRHTNNGGNTWISQDTGESDLYSVHFIDKNEGWIAGANGVIRHTSDSGNTWSLLDSGISTPIYAIQFENSQQGLIYTYNGLYKTDDGGLTWNKCYDLSNDTVGSIVPRNIVYIDKQKAIISTGVNGALLYNAGNVSTIGEYPTSSSSQYNSITKQSNNRIWLYNNSKKTFKTENGGENWVFQDKITTNDKIVRNPDIWGVAFSSEKEGILIESYNQYFTQDGGNTWIKTNTRIASSHFDNSNGNWYVHNLQLFGNSQHGWAINPSGDILRLGNP